MKVIIEKPNGSPYLTVSDDRHMVAVQLHDYDFNGFPVKFQFDRRTIPALIDALSRLNRGEDDAVIRTHSFNEDIE
jgi:hypothetical protein